jgi:hypothetical protein
MMSRDLLDRLGAVKPNHGNYRKAQDAIAEILKSRRERDEALAERTSLLERISSQKRHIDRLEVALVEANAKHTGANVKAA